MTTAPPPVAVSSRRPALGFIGGGVMAEALIGAVTGAGLVAPGAILVGEVGEERRRVLRERHGVGVTGDNLAAAGAELVVLAVKPQHLGSVLEQLRGRLREDTVVVSIVAGARLRTLCEGLGHALVVRAMPNTPARVRKAATFWRASAGVSGPALGRVRSLLGALGTEVEVDDEAGVEMATGLAGPMPAFVYLFIEAFIDAGVALGLSREQATLATVESMRGSLELLLRTQESPAELRAQVTSPGGATLAGLKVFEREGVREMVGAAVRAVHARAQELGQLALASRESGKDG